MTLNVTMNLTQSLNLSILPADSPIRVERSDTGARLVVPRGCQASVVERYDGHGQDGYNTYAKLEVAIADDATLTHYKLVQEAPNAIHQSFLEVQMQNRSSFTSHVFLLRGASIRNTIHVRLEGDHAACSLNGLYTGSAEQIIETHTVIDHI